MIRYERFVPDGVDGLDTALEATEAHVREHLRDCVGDDDAHVHIHHDEHDDGVMVIGAVDASPRGYDA
ncbi:hypothetical protein [Pseudonocardia sp. ICBG1142]|uniref:hypothetical protein n=1 Tax=Pseudonocardia sp. ICBG1142 TaxID=2846760 RepID=UPI001CF61CE0|nr:hypothetical protein [Pseudonocardia sp. ICBG1142]